MQLDRMLSAGVEQGVGQLLAPRRLEQRGRQPYRLEAVEHMAGLGEIAGPEDVVERGVRPLVRANRLRHMCTEKLRIPCVARGDSDDARSRCDAEIRR